MNYFKEVAEVLRKEGENHFGHRIQYEFPENIFKIAKIGQGGTKDLTDERGKRSNFKYTIKIIMKFDSNDVVINRRRVKEELRFQMEKQMLRYQCLLKWIISTNIC